MIKVKYTCSTSLPVAQVEDVVKHQGVELAQSFFQKTPQQVDFIAPKAAVHALLAAARALCCRMEYWPYRGVSMHTVARDMRRDARKRRRTLQQPLRRLPSYLQAL